MEGFGKPVRVSVWCLERPFQSKSHTVFDHMKKGGDNGEIDPFKELF